MVANLFVPLFHYTSLINGESVLISPLAIVVVMISRWRQLCEAAILGDCSQHVCVHVRVCVYTYACLIYEPPKLQWSTRVKITYISSKEMSSSIPRGTCKPGANSQWFNAFKIEISLTFLGETISHLEKMQIYGQEEKLSCGFHLRAK